MEQIRSFMRRYPKVPPIVVAILIVVSATLILTAPFKLQIAEIPDLMKPHVVDALDYLDLEKIDENVLKADVISEEDADYLADQLADTLLTFLPGSVEVEISLADFEYVCSQYIDTRSFVESSVVSSDVLQQAILNVVIDSIIDESVLEAEDQIFQAINMYRTIFYLLILLALVAIVLVLLRRRFAVLVWAIPAGIISIGLAVLSTVGDYIIATNVYEDMYLRFPASMLMGLLLACAAQVLYVRAGKLAIEGQAAVAEGAEVKAEEVAARAEEADAEVEVESVEATASAPEQEIDEKPELEAEPALLPEQEPEVGFEHEPEAEFELNAESEQVSEAEPEQPAEAEPGQLTSEPETAHEDKLEVTPISKVDAEPEQEAQPESEAGSTQDYALDTDVERESVQVQLFWLRKENERLQKENDHLREENEFLRKVAAFFASK